MDQKKVEKLKGRRIFYFVSFNLILSFVTGFLINSRQHLLLKIGPSD